MNETIAAQATPFGPGAIALIRLTGEDSHAIAGKALRTDCERQEARTVKRAALRSSEGDVIDEVLVTVFRRPHSYTGENLVEISCHGGVLVVQRALDRLLECGARSAMAGEFTQRAFLNGKIDLTQAEAVMDVIGAQTDLALRAAQQQLGGKIGMETEDIRGSLLQIVAHLEAYIDFPDEDITPQTGEALVGQLEAVQSRIELMLATAEQGRILREGARVVIYGEPNVGKSSLLNILLGQERAIVSDIAGTTRDTVEEVVSLGGFPVRLIDTAGHRKAVDELERVGVERTLDKVAQADLVLEVVDSSAPRGQSLLRSRDKNSRSLLVLNKCDLPRHSDWNEHSEGAEISCADGSGLDGLIAAIAGVFAQGDGTWGQEAVAVNARHQSCLRRARGALGEALRQLKGGVGPEFVALDLRLALDAVGEVAGRVETEELLGEIFGQFCIGK
ncbi:MAG: tRNA uridine-5-carboxymethylaminomethyl(34) synthesis GTPase MnmE [Verrucomicrobiaceae bacterium]|nr:tRNA uridine-5-carboxymethylaminomethyl(34) synthesis GTPase MnmE [Roseibacillus sp.]MBJ06717.1 tRNA uridine-5-carboxymethylaminomethyl(34) synthesis GTPase MnmE [Verrucomicrobiaceae bacterium]